MINTLGLGLYKIIQRNCIANQIIKNSNTILRPKVQYPGSNNNQRHYPTYRINTPVPTKGTPEQFLNNPPLNIKGKIIMHAEVIETKCKIPGWLKNLCLNLCNTKISEKAVGHLTHGYEYATNRVSDSDLEQKKRPQYEVRYDKPHDIKQENNNRGDQKRTKEYNKKLQEIYHTKPDNGEDYKI
jgi:hypothetical protein